MGVISHLDEAFKEMREEAARRLQKAAVFFQKGMIKRLSVPNPSPYKTPSGPGEYPRKRSGNLIASVTVEPLDISSIIANDFTVQAGYAASGFYGVILEEHRDRLGIAKALEEMDAQITSILETGKR